MASRPQVRPEIRSGQRAGEAHPAPPIIEHAAKLLEDYDVLFCDVWGVVHNGQRAYDAAGEALTKFRARGGTVVLVSNAPVPQDRVAAMLDSRGVRRSAWDAIVSSGDIARSHIAEKDYERVYCVGPRDRDAALFTRLPARSVPLDEAEAIVCSGLEDDANETPEQYLPLLSAALPLKLPFVCANPDLVVEVGDRLYPCAGSIAILYEEMGGEVFWAGKPHASAYGTARKTAEQLRGAKIPSDRILAIGDAVRTDIAAAAGAGVDALFIAGGIHRADVMDGDAIDPGKLAALFAGDVPQPVAAMSLLRW